MSTEPIRLELELEPPTDAGEFCVVASQRLPDGSRHQARVSRDSLRAAITGALEELFGVADQPRGEPTWALDPKPLDAMIAELLASDLCNSLLKHRDLLLALCKMSKEATFEFLRNRVRRELEHIVRLHDPQSDKDKLLIAALVACGDVEEVMSR